jgi:hypothetical protein
LVLALSLVLSVVASRAAEPIPVLPWMAPRKGDAEIATILNAAEATVEKHRTRIFLKLGVEEPERRHRGRD